MSKPNAEHRAELERLLQLRTLGTSVDTALAATHATRFVVAEINEQMPRTLGHTLVPLDRLHAFIHTNRPLHVHESVRPTPIEDAIGEQVAALVADGATLQMGKRPPSTTGSAARRTCRPRAPRRGR